MIMMMMMIFNRMHCPLIVVPDWSVHHCRCACSRTWLDERSATRARSSGWPAATKVGLLLFPFSVLVYRVFVPKCDLEWGLYSYIFYDCYMSLLKNIQACTTIRIVSSTMCHNLLFSNQFKNWMRINQYAFIWNVFDSSFQHLNQSVEEKAYFSPFSPSPPQTSSSEYWMLSLASSATRRSTTADSAISCTTSCTGWTFLIECSTSCEQRSIYVCSTMHHSTWRTASSTPQTLLVASICGPPAAIGCSYRDTGVPCSVVGPFPQPARRPAGTRYRTRPTCEVHHVPLTVFAATWKLFFSRFTRVHSALEALQLCAM